MSDFNWKQALATVAPGLATALGGPLSGTAVAAIVNALGLEGKDVPIQKAIESASPADLLKLKEADAVFIKDMAKLGIEVLTLENADRASARSREVAVKDSTVRILAYMAVGSFVAMCSAVLMGWTKAESVMAGTIIGYASAMSQQVMAYYFGSSSGSDLKTRLMGFMEKKPGA